jgi:signal transduction histidine kinase/DNA-binding NarL/FixJ family response regulator
MPRWRDLWAGLALGWVGSLVVAAPSALPILIDDAPRVSFAGHLSVLEDPAGTLDLAAVRVADSAERFRSITAGNFNFGFPEGAVWLRFSVANPTPEAQERWLALDNSLLASAILFLVDGDGAVTTMTNGASVPVERRPLASGRILFPLVLDAGQTRTAYLRVSGAMALASDMALWRPIAYSEAEWRRMGVKSLVIAGAIAAVVLFSLYFWQYNRRLGVLAIGLGDVCYGIATFMVDGVAATWFPANEQLWQCRFSGALVLLGGAFQIVFARVFLDLPRTAPQLARAMNVLVGVSILAAAMQGLMLNLKVFTFYSVLTITTAATVVVAVAAWRGIRNARFYLVAWGGLLLVIFLVMAGAVAKVSTAIYASTLPLPSFLLASLVLVYAMYRDAKLSGETSARARQHLLDLRRTEQERLTMAVEARTQELRQAKAEAEEAGRARLAFLSTVSHELRTPLHTILGYAQLLRKTGGRREADAKLATIETSGLQLLHLIDEILEFIRGDAHAVMLRPTSVVLDELVKQLDDTGQVLALAGGNQFHIELAEDLPPAVEVDEHRLLQVLCNLISNGCKYTSNGRVVLRIESVAADVAETLPAGMHQLRFLVEDTGIGIAPDQQTKLFEPFQRLHGDEYRPGIGLGLSIARQVVRTMGGDIGVESQPGLGSRFFFTLTVSGGQAGPSRDFAPIPRIVGYLGTERTLLVADDIAENREFLSDLCGAWGFRVLVAKDGAEALAICRQGDPALACVLVDQFMPGMDGWAFLRELRAGGDLLALPVILISAAEPQRPPGFPANLAFDRVLLKPIRQDELANSLRRLLGIEWQVESASHPALVSAEQHEVPPANDLDELREMLALGRVVAIRRWAEKLVEQGPELAGFGTEVAALAEAVDFPGLHRLLKQADMRADRAVR